MPKEIGEGHEMTVLQRHPDEEQQFTDLLRREEEETVVEDVQCCQQAMCH